MKLTRKIKKKETFSLSGLTQKDIKILTLVLDDAEAFYSFNTVDIAGVLGLSYDNVEECLDEIFRCLTRLPKISRRNK